MRKIKVSPSLLQQWRVVRKGLYNSDTQTLIDYIVGDYKVTPAISRGTAYHKLLEDGPEKYRAPGEPERYSVFERELNYTWEFTREAVEPVFHLRERYKDMVHEQWARWEVTRRGMHIVSNMRLDGIEGRTLHEHKTTGSAKYWLDYYESLQWRLNLLAEPELDAVVYHVFQLNEKNNWCKYQTFRFERYDTIEADVLAELDAFLTWLADFPELLPRLTIR